MNIEILCYFCLFFLFLFHSLRKLKCTRCLVSEKIGEVRKLWHFYVFLVSWQYTIASIKLNGCISELRILFCISDTFQQFYWKILRISLVSNYIGNQISGIILSHYMFFLFIFSNSLADNLKDLLRFLRRDDPQSRSVFKQVCKWNTVSKDLIPIIEHCQDDRNLVLNAGKGLFILHYMFFFFFFNQIILHYMLIHEVPIMGFICWLFFLYCSEGFGVSYNAYWGFIQWYFTTDRIFMGVEVFNYTQQHYCGGYVTSWEPIGKFGMVSKTFYVVSFPHSWVLVY